jgi:hypothetical protein
VPHRSRAWHLRAIACAEGAFAEQNAEGRRKILLALGLRYEHLQIDAELTIERPWLRDVYDKLIAFADGLSPIPRGALKEWIKSYLEKVIPILEVQVALTPSGAGPVTPEPPLT